MGGSMAYLRGDYYLWTDSEDRLHIWAANGQDGWDDTIWHRNEDGEVYERHLKDGADQASGTSIPHEVMDEYVVMRLAQILSEGTVAETIDRTLGPDGRGGGNIGGQRLKKNAEKIKAALSSLIMDAPDRL